MKKTLLSICAMLLSCSMFANEATLGEGQIYMGPYFSDAYSTSGLGLTSYPGTYTMISVIPTADLSIYNGSTLVGMRAAFAQTFGATSTLELWGIKSMSTFSHDVIASQETRSNAVVGWNQVTFSSPVTLDFSQYEAIGFTCTYKQTSSNYPISAVEEGTVYDTYLYGTLGGSTNYYDIGLSSYGNLSVQAIVEGVSIADNAVAIAGVEPVFVEANKTANAEITIKNVGGNSVSSISYSLNNGEQVVEEQEVTLTEIMGFMGTSVISVPVNGIDTDGVVQATLQIVKVNGEANNGSDASLTFDVTTMSRIFEKRVVVEEFTGTGCGYCPRGIVGMQLMREKYGDKFVGAALHRYNSSDPMYISTSIYPNITFSGAPSCMMNRISGEIDPYYGANSSLRGVFASFDQMLKRIAPVGVEVSGEYADDEKKTVKATATIEALTEGDYKIEFAVIADSVYISTAKQSNYYYQYTTDQAGEDMAPFCRGGAYGKSSFNWAFDDVALCGSYVSGKNQVPQTHANVGFTTVEYTMTLPTKAALVGGLNYRKMFVACYVIDKTSGEIVNAAKSAYMALPGEAVAIEAVEAVEAVEEPVFNLAGQEVAPASKGLNIVGGKVRFNF